MMKQRNAALLLPLILMVAVLTGCDKVEEEKSAQLTLRILPSTLKIKGNDTTYAVTGLDTYKTNRMAIINNEVYTEGAEIAPGIELKEIELTYARIIVGEEEHLLRPADLQHSMDLQEQMEKEAEEKAARQNAAQEE